MTYTNLLFDTAPVTPLHYVSPQFIAALIIIIIVLQFYFHRKAEAFIRRSVSDQSKRRNLKRFLVAWLIVINLPHIGVVLFLARILAFQSNSATAQVFAWIMYPFYIWQFGLVLFFVLFAGASLIRGILRLCHNAILFLRDRESAQQRKQVAESRRKFVNGLAVGAATVPFATIAYGIVAAEQFFEIERVRIPIRNLPPEFEGFRIVQLSDIHAGMFMTQARMSDLARAANALQPDLIALTGDYVATSSDSVGSFMKAFGDLSARYGVFGVLGNHDVFTGATDILQRQFRAKNFRLMINEQHWIERNGAKLNLIGIEFLPQRDTHLDGVLSGLTLDGPSILLSHQPNVLPNAAAKNIDLTLSGHLHGGQVRVELLGNDIAPSKIVSPYIAGLYKQGQSQMYLNRGLGTTGVPIRINSRPEITEITLVRDPNS